ncbi:hypothetical protein [Halopseudomonas pelagia]|uniref:hypothetical protein n=1 Tax=Halopseudomonas pelagia TaxID=553151 RepID=UPI0030DA3B80
MKRDIESITSTSLKDAIKSNRTSLLLLLDSVGDKNADHYNIVSKKIRHALDRYKDLLDSQKSLYQNAPKAMKDWDNEELVLNEIATLKDEWEKALPKSPCDAEELFHYKFNFACYYLEIAAQAFDKKQFNQAWPAVNHSSFIIGEMSRLKDEIHEQIDKQKTSTQNSKNSGGRTKNIKDVMLVAANLIVANKPVDGWKNKPEVKKNIAPMLAEYIKTNKVSGLTSTNTYRTLGEWLADNPVHNAWKTCSRPK